MYYHPERRLVYLAHPHTASRSTSQALMKLGFRKERREGHHAQLYENGIVTPENRDEWTVFTTVRNHYDLILAQVWKVALARNLGEEPSKELGIWQRDLGRAAWIGKHTLFGLHSDDADWLIRYETLHPELERIVGPIKLGRVGKNTKRLGRHYREFYTDEIRKWVEDRFGKEMDKLGYRF